MTGHPLERILPCRGGAFLRRFVLSEVLGPPAWVRPALRQPPPPGPAREKRPPPEPASR